MYITNMIFPWTRSDDHAVESALGTEGAQRSASGAGSSPAPGPPHEPREASGGTRRPGPLLPLCNDGHGGRGPVSGLPCGIPAAGAATVPRTCARVARHLELPTG